MVSGTPLETAVSIREAGGGAASPVFSLHRRPGDWLIWPHDEFWLAGVQGAQDNRLSVGIGEMQRIPGFPRRHNTPVLHAIAMRATRFAVAAQVPRGASAPTTFIGTCLRD